MNEKPVWLPELVRFEDNGNNWDKYLEVIYSYYMKDFVESRPVFKGRVLQVKRMPIDRGKDATFWHIIQSGTSEANKQVDFDRCARIRWPKAIIENDKDNEIKIWENKRDGERRICIWLEKFNYIVIIAKRKDYLLFWTAYNVYEHMKKKFYKEIEAYKLAGSA